MLTAARPSGLAASRAARDSEVLRTQDTPASGRRVRVEGAFHKGDRSIGGCGEDLERFGQLRYPQIFFWRSTTLALRVLPAPSPPFLGKYCKIAQQ